MSLPHARLTSLAERPGSGSELASRFDRSIGYFWQATHQQIYRELARLEAAGWVEAAPVEAVPVEAKIDLAAEPAAPRSTRPAVRNSRSAPTPEPAATSDASTATEAPSDPAADRPANARKGSSAKAGRGAR